MAGKLSESEVKAALQNLPNWHSRGEAIERDMQFSDFREAMAFINKVADAAEAAGHHPDFYVSYNKVKFSLVSHDSGGVTQRDIKMASRINEIAG